MIEIEGIKFYSVMEVAKKLHLTPQTVRAYINDGKIAGKKIGRSFLVSHKELLRFLGEPEGESRDER